MVFLTFILLSTGFISISTPPTSDELSSYECGFEPLGLNHVPFCIKFFLLAIIFIVFDVEVSFVVPSLFSSSLIFSFTIVLLLGLIYEYSYGGLS